MSLFEVIVLGIVQGLTEFLPISSTAHLVLIPRLFWGNDPGLAFDIALHVGTLAAVLIYFFRDWVQIVAQGFGLEWGSDPVLQRNRMLLWWLVLGTIPAGIVGLLFEKQADSTLRTPFVIGSALILVGLFMWWADRASRGKCDMGAVSAPDSVVIGAAQALAVIPGVSRSGITISAGLSRNLDRPTAARFSFLLSTPIILGAGAKDAWDLFRHQGGVPHALQVDFAVGIAVSAIVGFLTIAFFLNFLRRRTLAFFVAYRIVFGIIVFALAKYFR
ncbi:MAG TPA: undecaprenyl-diphosphatase UppP [Bryobacteraceae bacterium]|nr:undecaprenyl-diphosphatase UppP [Bryobacteraceae bacterium]